MRTVVLVLTSAALAVATAISAGAADQSRPRHTTAELEAIIRNAVEAEKKALKDFDAGKNDSAKKDLQKSLGGLNDAVGSTSGTTAGNLGQATLKDELAIETLPMKHERERVRSLINHAIVNKQFALDAIKKGTTTPLKKPASKPPKVSPIHAHFVEEESSTDYTIEVSGYPSGAKITYLWTLTPPTVDPPCNNLGNLTSTDSEFVWEHGPGPPPFQNNPGNCDHRKEVPGIGHDGIVTVVVNVGSWKCTATYHGTVSGEPAPAEVAPQPKCVKKVFH